MFDYTLGMRTPPPDVDEARTLPAPVLIAASVQPVLSGTVVEDESNHEILDAIDHAHQQLIAAEIAELVGILRAADRWKIDQDAVGAGIERLIQPGHDGTPRIAEFLALEIGALLGISQPRHCAASGTPWTCAIATRNSGKPCSPEKSGSGKPPKSASNAPTSPVVRRTTWTQRWPPASGCCPGPGS